jgi:phenylalanyl-tRNA synthetase beta chain
MRARLLPGLLHAAARNRARGVRSVALFEVGRVFGLDDPVREREMAALVLHGPSAEGWHVAAAAFDALDATGVVASVMEELRIDGWSLGDAPGSPMHPGRSAEILLDGRRVGVVGELHPRVAADLELEGRVAVAELAVELLRAAAEAATFRLAEVPRFPPIRRDLAFVVSEDVPAGAVRDALQSAVGELLGSTLLFDVHRGPPLDPGTKSLAFAVEFRARDRTLTGEEADAAVAAAVDRLSTAFGAALRTA